MIETAVKRRPAAVNALDFHRVLPGTTDPVALGCSDDRIYAVKGIHRGRELCAEQVVAHLGQAMGAPVAEVRLVHVPQEIIDDRPVEMRFFKAGVSHGSLMIENCTDRLPLEPYADTHNRRRLAQLAILWGWVDSHDCQVVKLKTPPESIFSVDHGECLPYGDVWSPETLGPDALPKVAPHLAVRMSCGISDREIATACKGLRHVSDEHIATAVASPPEGWGINLNERVALAEFLARRRDDMIATILGNERED
ncbi:MAG TPA: HipA family kinase [Longimicrobium sp.]|jgi:hypothetical protein